MELREIFLKAAEYVKDDKPFACNAIKAVAVRDLCSEEKALEALEIFQHVFRPARKQDPRDAYWRAYRSPEGVAMKAAMLVYLAHNWQEYVDEEGLC